MEPLHALENGIINDCLKILYTNIDKSLSLSELDELVRNMTLFPRQRFATSGTNNDMPRLLWHNGVSNLSDLTGACKVGIMFTIVVLSLREDGRNFFIASLGNASKVNAMRDCFEMILCYWMWLKKDTYWDQRNLQGMHKSSNKIRRMLTQIKETWPRTEGQGWDIAKFHEQLHVPDDIFTTVVQKIITLVQQNTIIFKWSSIQVRGHKNQRQIRYTAGSKNL